MTQFLKSRRDFIKNGLAFTGGLTLSASGLAIVPELLRSQGVAGLDTLLSYAQAQAASTPVLVQFVLIDKVQASLFQTIEGTPAPGADSQDGIAQRESTFRNLGLNELFGNSIAELPDSVALSINNTWESGSNGHSLANSQINAALGSINNAFETLSGTTGILGPVGFSIRSSANDSQDAFLGAGGRPLKTFESVESLSQTIENSVSPLRAMEANKSLVAQLDSLITSDTSIRESLNELMGKVENVAPELTAAAAAGDSVEAQVQSVISLAKAGLSRNFMIAVPWDDTNSGGDLTSGGGAFNLDPFAATPQIGQAIVRLHAAIPNLVCVSTSDGGRGPDNGDTSAGFAFMTGPADKLNNSVIGGRFTNTDQLGQTFADAALSNGTRQPSNPANWYASALKILGHSIDVPHVTEAIK
jgi:hypothetical protein